MKLPPPLPQTGPPSMSGQTSPSDEESLDGQLPNPLLGPVAMERLLMSSSSAAAVFGGAEQSTAAAPAASAAEVATTLPSALEQTIRIKKGSDPLGINVEVVDGGINGVVVTSVTRGGAVQRDGRLKAGDYLVSVNHETMRSATNAQARAILRRTQLVSTDVR